MQFFHQKKTFWRSFAFHANSDFILPRSHNKNTNTFSHSGFLVMSSTNQNQAGIRWHFSAEAENKAHLLGKPQKLDLLSQILSPCHRAAVYILCTLSIKIGHTSSQRRTWTVCEHVEFAYADCAQLLGIDIIIAYKQNTCKVIHSQPTKNK